MLNHRTILCLLLLLYCPALLADAADRPAPEQSLANANIPRQEIALTFDLAHGQLIATARITIPAAMSLHLDCKPLTLTGGILKAPHTTPWQIKPGKNRVITLPRSPDERLLILSWKLTAPGGQGGDNLISPQGITLAGFWHPVADTDMLFSVKARLPAGFTAITEADTSQTTGRGAEKRFQAAFGHPLPAIHFIAGPYKVATRKLPSLTLKSYFFQEDAALAADYLDRAAAFINRYTRLIGPYPYPSFSIVENRLPTGYGMPTFTLLGQVVVRLPFIKDTSLGHEILHSWFGNSVFLREDQGNWCEGLTTYLADQQFAADRHQGPAYRKKQLLRYQAYVPMDNRLKVAAFHNAAASPEQRAVGYDKTSMFFHMLRRHLGDDLFFQALRRFYATRKFQRSGWRDIEEIFEHTSHRDLKSFFAQWLERTDIPDLRLSEAHLTQARGKSLITLTLEQKTKTPYTLDIPVRITTLTSTVDRHLHLDQKKQTVSLSVDTLPQALAIDPDYDLMRRLTDAETPPAWILFLGKKNKTLVLGRQEDKAVYQPLIQMFTRQGATLTTPDRLEQDTLSRKNILFLGPCRQSRGLFGAPAKITQGFLLDVHKNPLDHDKIMVLVTASSRQETAAVVHRLSHYGPYSHLYFRGGQLQEKKTAPSAKGIQVNLAPAPAGIPVQAVQDFPTIMDDLATARVVHIGEVHTDYGSHLLQLQIIQALYNRHPDLAIGMEMFPRASQPALDAYIRGDIKDETTFLLQSRYFKVWGYDYRFYQPIIDFARTRKIPLVALNLDKKIVSHVFRTGSLKGLSASELQQLPLDRDLDVPGYQERLAAVFANHRQSPHQHGLAGFIQAQSIWDETMAQTAAAYLEAHPGKHLVILAGTGHIYADSGIPLRLRRRGVSSQKVVAPLVTDSTGRKQGMKVDYLMFTQTGELPPVGKIGVVLNEEKGGSAEQPHLRILEISPHSKGKQAGLQKNDIILSINGHTVHTVDELRIRLLNTHPGDHVTLRIRRQRELLSDQTLDLDIELSAPTVFDTPGPITPHPRK